MRTAMIKATGPLLKKLFVRIASTTDNILPCPG